MIKALISPSPEPPVSSPEWCCRTRAEKLFPDAEWKFHPLLSSATKVNHPFLQALVDIHAHVGIMMGDWTVLAYESLILLHVYRDFINLECIATPEEFRGRGSAGKCMKALVMVSDETGIPIRLRACNVTGGGWNMLPQHPVIAAGMKKKGKMPVRKLPEWYKKFGFELVANVYYQGKAHGYNMQYIPKPKHNSNDNS